MKLFLIQKKKKRKIKGINAEAEVMAVNLPDSPLVVVNLFLSSVPKEELIPSFSDLANDKVEVERSPSSLSNSRANSRGRR